MKTYAKVICVYIENEEDTEQALEEITSTLEYNNISFSAEVVSEITDYKL